MPPVVHVMLILFIAAWFVAVGGWFYGTRFFLPMWAGGFRASESRAGYGRKALRGYVVFVGAVIFGFVVDGLAQLDGGWGKNATAHLQSRPATRRHSETRQSTQDSAVALLLGGLR